MARKPETVEFGDVAITTTPLAYPKAEDIMPDVLLVVSHVIRQVATTDILQQLKDIKAKQDIVKLLPVLAPIMQTLGERLGSGKLKELVPLILASTTVKLPDAEGKTEKRELGNLKDRSYFFDEHPELYWFTLFFAGKVTFSRFFSVRDLLTGKSPAAEQS